MTMTPQLLLQQFNQMPEGMKQELLDFLEYLAFKYKIQPTDNAKAADAKKEVPERKAPKAGFLKGTFTMADDFDAPLEDFKDYR